MSQVLLVLSTWFHVMATVILIGYYLLLSLVYLPYLSTAYQGDGIKTALGLLSEQVRPWMVISLLVFVVTGLHLMIESDDYLGVGDFGNTWSGAMVAKHVLVVVMIGLGVGLNITLKYGTVRRIKNLIYLQSVLGSSILFLTAVAQVQ